MRPGDTPNVGPQALNTMEMSIAKQKKEKDKKELAAIKKQKCTEAHLALVRLLVPPTTHQDLLRVMPERELLALTHSQLAAQAALLMTNEDPHGMIACSGIAIDQFIIALSAVTAQAQQRLIAKLHGGAADVLPADASPSSGADDDSSANSNDDNDGTRLLFGDNGFDGTQDDDAPVTATLPDPVVQYPFLDLSGPDPLPRFSCCPIVGVPTLAAE